jgi:short-subunit dehydrogenase
MENVALITGASSGIGKELAKIHAANGGDLVLVARREKELTELKNSLESEYKVSIVIIPKDLSDTNTPAEIFTETEKLGIQVEYLINNAGFGGHGFFHEREMEKDLAMVNVNITSLMLLTRLYLPGMIERKKGKILNVSSTASFLPGPLQAVYYASKAFVTSFSQALAEELNGTGVTVTALCPGPVATGFFDTANMHGVKMLKAQKAMTPAKTAAIGYRDMMKGRLLSFDNGLLNFSLNWLVPLLPRRWVLKVSRMTMEK